MSASFGKIDPHHPMFHFGFKTWLNHVLAQLMLARADIELPTVPRARDDATGQFPFPERAALMWAHAIERKKTTVDVEQGNYLFADHNFARAARGAVCDTH